MKKLISLLAIKIERNPIENFHKVQDKFEDLFDKLVRDNKLDKFDMMKKLRLDKSVSHNLLEEGESQFNDLLLDEHILDGEDSIEDE
jgi:hypothetical protein